MKDRSTRTFQPFTTVRQGSKHLAARLPTDLAGVVGFVALAVVLLAVIDVGSILARAAIGFPLLFFVPGYVTVAALFPRGGPDHESGSPVSIDRCGVSPLERVALAFGLSVAILPLLGLVIAVAWGFSAGVVVATVAGYATVVAWIGAIRRLRVPTSERYRFSLVPTVETARARIFDTRSSFHAAVNVVLVASLIVALTTVGYALVAPQQGEQYTGLEILTENDAGELVTEHPDEVVASEPFELTIGVENREGQDAEYTVVVQEQWISDDTVIERNELQRIDFAVSDGDTAHGDRDVTPVAEGGDVRIAVLLYEGDDVPETPTTENAYRYGYFWTEIVDEIDASSDE
ncbi:DUF1616 domain-containing protein [Natrarchaeobius halalkaliphilus]|uniref:DUF1616 domain-containing protein n=1 Tax=Natrarchaeobius halalkaliphilus TaxID=1679091 RepID=A0A3N6P491_9EURY|nr:DUF1616 domain-containing protein [Natrarchaeobius halalkaliphilus]RQG90185.1 DUF1616 domain-containing protein [Natrarchaeobius halalkaliphilus]